MNKILANIENLMGINCKHRAVKSENSNYCPDCGKKVVIKLVCIKCRQCGHLRRAVNKKFSGIIPKRKFCSYCGCKKWGFQYYYDSNIPDKIREISVKQVFLDKENPFTVQNINKNTDIWIEKPANNGKTFKSNVIKAKKV